jgi:hypothetical protein
MSEQSEYDDAPERLAGALDEDAEDSKDAYERFIWENRQKLGALSWSGLLRYGRGIVLIDARSWKDEDTEEDKAAQLRYLPEERIAGLSQTPQKKDALTMLRTYNPREEIIVNVLRADGSGSFFQIALKDCPPPEAYRKLVGGEDIPPQWEDAEE